MNMFSSVSANADEQKLRVDLAVMFRVAVSFGWHESVGNHFSAAVSSNGRKFLMNPRWMHFALVRASDLLLLDVDDAETMMRPNAPDLSAWNIHGRIHSQVPRARCLLHCHPPYATALVGLADPGIKPIDQNTARFYNRVAIDLAFEGIANEEDEGMRLASALGNHQVMMMGNHGVLICADTIPNAFEHLYFLERAAKTMVLAYSTGQKLNIMSDELAERTAQGWEPYVGMGEAHFAQQKKLLDRIDASYAD